MITRLIEKCNLSKSRAIKEEKGIYEYTVDKANRLTLPVDFKVRKFRETYFNKSRQIYINLLSDSYVGNTELHQHLRKKQKLTLESIPNIAPGRMAFMTPQEMYPGHWKELIDERNRQQKLMYEERDDDVTGEFQCGKCKSWKTKHREAMTRSADEPMTVFIKCKNCGASWKQ